MSRHPETAVRFREMVPSDIEVGLRLCRASGWNQVRRDWEMFLRLSPHACRVAIKDAQVVGTVATVNYEDRFAWVAMVLVDAKARGSGIGTQLVKEALAVLTDVRSIRLDATPAGRGVYRQLGFVGEYGLSRMAAVVSTDSVMTRDHRGGARPMTPDDLAAVLGLDGQVFGADRRVLIEWLLEGAPEYAWVHEARGQISGYVLGRHGFSAEHLGPVIAHDQHVARQLVTACLHQQTGKQFILDATRSEAEWRIWLESLGFREQRPFIRMSRGEAPSPGLPAQQFAIMGPEFG
jgi:ribosomal protein S18 acetylase RimI-like enzyme